jgi:hypothetical protein
MRKKIDPSSVILQFSDDEGVIHEVGIYSILEGGTPIDEESGDDMKFLAAYVLD